MRNNNIIKYLDGNSYIVGTYEDNIQYFNFIDTMSYLKALAQSRDKDFKLNAHDKKIYEQLFYYFTNNQNYFNGSEINFKKGLLIVGANGVGKSTILKLFTDFFFEGKNRFYYISNLALQGNDQGTSVLDQINFKHDYCLDDIGSESKTIFYGQHFEVFEHVIKKHEQTNFPEYRPDQKLCGKIWSSTNFKSSRIIPNRKARIYATTNLSLSEIESRYGSRIYSRIASFFNVINFPTVNDKRIAGANIVR